MIHSGTIVGMFIPLPDKPDPNAIELAMLDFWSQEDIFARLRVKNADGPRFSFIDGPVTANKTLGVHTAWGRTLKDVFQRYKGLQGYHQRYQNGFDCQGLWIEVGVEKELGLNSKKEIEEYGLANFAKKCRAVVEWSSSELIKGSVRLGQWMDWGRDYYTFADNNIQYIWKFLKLVHERGWLYRGHRATEWCPRCGTSISAHELVGSYIDREDPSLTVRFPLLDRPGEALVIWTTTPWTLPANVAAAVHPEARYGRLGNGDWVAVERGDGRFTQTLDGAAMVGWRYQGPFDDLAPGSKVEHRVIPWDEVSMNEGTGIVHIAPGCGIEDFEVGRTCKLPILTPVDEAGRFHPEYGWLAGMPTTEVAGPIVEWLRDNGTLVSAETISHRFAECWRCHTPLIFRISDDWFISVKELREPMREANRTVEWTPAYMGLRMDDWLVNMSDWNISRRRYYGLPLPFYPCECGHLTVIGSHGELAERATSSLDQLEELRRPWIDDVRISCQSCGAEVERIKEVGDVWLDAGIVPFSTLGWQNPVGVPAGLGDGAGRGMTTADLPDHAYWEEWFPADWVSEMREQIRLWFYSQLFMSVALTGRAPYRRVLGYEKMLDERGREMHGSWGNMITAEEAFQRMGADVMRWQYCMQPPNQNLLFGFSPGQQIQRKLLTFWNSAAFFIQYANVAGFKPSADHLERAAPAQHPLDQWLQARTAQLIAETTEAYESYLTVNVLRSFESFIDDLSTWYIRRSRRRFWNSDAIALQSLWVSLVQAVRVISPVMPFLAEHLWQRMVVPVSADAPRSVFLAGWPAAAPFDKQLLDDFAAVRKVVELGRSARKLAQLRLRQPLRLLLVEGIDGIDPYLGEIADELRVKEVRIAPIESTQLRVRPNLPVVGRRLGKDVPLVRRALDAGDCTMREDGAVEVAGHLLGPEEVLVERLEKEGWAVAADEGVTVAFDMTLDDALRLEARVYDLIHHVNTMRRDIGLQITDRIFLTLPESDSDLLQHRDWIAAETLARSIMVGDSLALVKAG
jgi:isoleucyl-tRNA synthetase